MDKLDLDARVTRLEWRISTLMISLLAVAGVALLSAVLMTSRSEAPPATVATPAPMPVPDTVKVATEPRHPSSNRLVDLDSDLGKLHELQSQGLINPGDFAAKKALILAKPILIGDFADDMRIARKLADSAIINNKEYEELKTKILEIGR